MFSTLITVTLFVSLAIQGVFAGFAISTPKLLQCQPAQISWGPTTPPYTLEIVPAEQPCGDALETIGGLKSTIFHYTSKFVPGTQVVFYISDSAGNEAWSGNTTVVSGNSSCIPGTPSVSVPLKLSTTPLATPTGSSASKSSSSVPLGGAINAGPNLTGGALSVRQASTPLLSITALAAMLALTL